MADAHTARADDSAQEITCRTCEEMKPISGFYVSNRTRCKDCVKARVKHRARTNPAVQEYDRRRAKTPERRAKAREVTRRWRAENPLRNKAHTAVAHALRNGTLAKEPCLFCGEAEVHAHHRDYERPLDVTWLCPKCHHRLHAAFPETAKVDA